MAYNGLFWNKTLRHFFMAIVYRNLTLLKPIYWFSSAFYLGFIGIYSTCVHCTAKACKAFQYPTLLWNKSQSQFYVAVQPWVILLWLQKTARSNRLLMTAPGRINGTEKIKKECSEMHQNALISCGNHAVFLKTWADVYFYSQTSTQARLTTDNRW